MLGIDWLEWVGYLASIIIMASMLMSSIIRLRWINMTGALLFSFYGFMISAPPVGILNGFIVLINMYHLFKIYRRKEYFKILDIKSNDSYFLSFLEYYKKDIIMHFPAFQQNVSPATINVFILRNMAIAGVFLAREISEGVLKIELDFVIPEYRDFKLGHFIFSVNKNYFIQRGYRKLIANSETNDHARYLRKMNFKQVNKKNKPDFVLEISQ